MTQCKIQWIDSNGKPTPDFNNAIGRVRREAYDSIVCGKVWHHITTDWYPICAEHYKQFIADGLESEHWAFEPFTNAQKEN